MQAAKGSLRRSQSTGDLHTNRNLFLKNDTKPSLRRSQSTGALLTPQKPYQEASLSYKTNRLIASIYKKLSGEEIPTSPSANPIFKRKVSYTDKVYRNMILEMNRFIKQQRHSFDE